MKEVCLVTPTYNHPIELKRLYETLKKQTDKNFTWVIIDDGSEEATENVVKEFLLDEVIEIVYKKKKNGGKSSAVNQGLDLVSKSVYFLIVDDDESFYPDAIKTIRAYVEKYRNTDCGVMDFLRDFRNMKTEAEEKDYFMTLAERKRNKKNSDGYTGYFTKALKDNRFPIYPGEKYIAPSVLLLKVSQTSRILWVQKALGETEYLEGGLTKLGRRLRVKNPQGMILYCALLQDRRNAFSIRFKYSVMGYAYALYSGLSKEKRNAVGIDSLLWFAWPFSVVLFFYWKIALNKK